jgi:hypothetical protein
MGARFFWRHGDGAATTTIGGMRVEDSAIRKEPAGPEMGRLGEICSAHSKDAKKKIVSDQRGSRTQFH